MTDRPEKVFSTGGRSPEGADAAGTRSAGWGDEYSWRAARSVSGVTLTSGLGAVLGLVSSGLVAYHFGAGRLTDAFFLAQSIPLVLAQLLQSGPLPSVFLPIFVRVRQQVSEEAAWRSLNNLLNVVLILNVVLAALGFYLAPWIVRAVGAGFDEPTLAASARVLRFLIFTVFSHSLLGVLAIALNALNLFVLPASFSLLPSLAVVVCVGTLAPSMGLDAWILGNLAGPAASILALGLCLMKEGYRYRPVLDLRQPELRETVRRASEFFISSVFTQGQTLSTKFVASLLAPGSLSALAYAERIFMAASALFTIPLPNVVFPELVRMKVSERLEDLKDLVFQASRVLVLILLPISVGMMTISGLVVGVLLQRGAFGPEEAVRTAWALALYFAALVPLGYKMLFTNTQYALGGTRVIVLGLCAAQGTIIAGNFLLGWTLGYVGIPIAHALGQLVLVGVHLRFLKASFPLGGIFWSASARRSLAAAVLMGAAAVLLQWVWPVGRQGPALLKTGALAGVILASAAVYGGLVFGFGVPEVRGVAASVRARLRRGASGPVP